MEPNQQITEKQILEKLEREGLSWRDYFLLGEGDRVLVCTFSARNGLMAMIIEDNFLSEACKDWLKNKGARHFLTDEEMEKHYVRDGKG